MHRRCALTCLLSFSLSFCVAAAFADEPLLSWRDGKTKSAIVDFVERVTDEQSEDFVDVTERIAVFDNDGTLWCEQPMYVQLAFALDRVKTLAPEHPEWKTKQPLKAVLENDLKTVAASGEKGLVELVMASHAGMTTAEFETIARDWIETAKHPKFDRRYTDCVYQPMVELLGYLRSKGFKTFIVSGGGVEFMRPWAEATYGIPPEQVVGSTIKTELQHRDGRPVLVRLPQIDFIDDKAGKPVAINKFIGRRPLMAFGNSDGDFEMLEWTTTGDGPRFGAIVHHTDGEREYAYDRKSSIGKLAKGLDEAADRGWVLIDMQHDWNAVFPPAGNE